MGTKGLPNYGAIKLIKVKSNALCYTKKSVEKKIEGMYKRIDYLFGQNQRLKRIEKEYKLWKNILNNWSRGGVKQLIEEYEKED